jgi:uncharacterized membrane protein YkvA (DUF1232 family)
MSIHPADTTPDATDDARTSGVRANFWQKFKRVAARLPFAEELVAAYYCAMDPATPTGARATLIGALAYFIMPLDWVPDVLLGFGYLDDAAILAMAVKAVADHITPAHRLAAQKVIEDQDNQT